MKMTDAFISRNPHGEAYPKLSLRRATRSGNAGSCALSVARPVSSYAPERAVATDARGVSVCRSNWGILDHVDFIVRPAHEPALPDRVARLKTRARTPQQDQRGAALMFALVVMAILSVGTSVLWSQIHQNLSDQRRAWHREQAFQLAEAGLEHAIAALRAGQKVYTGDTEVPLGPGSFSVTVEPGGAPGSYLIEARGVLDNAAYHYDRAALRATLHLSPSGKVDRYAWQPIKGES